MGTLDGENSPSDDGLRSLIHVAEGGYLWEEIFEVAEEKCAVQYRV